MAAPKKTKRMETTKNEVTTSSVLQAKLNQLQGQFGCGVFVCDHLSMY